MIPLLDTHYHLSFIADRRLLQDFLKALPDVGCGVVGQSLLPSESLCLMEALGGETSGVRTPMISTGFHPWRITSPEQVQRELTCFEAALKRTRFVGEIGLDFSPKRLEQAGRPLQEYVFRQLLERIAARSGAENKPQVLSIHAVQSTTAVLDILEAAAVQQQGIVPVLHRFSGTSDELTRLMRLGGCISVQPRMLASKRGRAYVRQIPGDRLLLETDLPSDAARYWTWDQPGAVSALVEAVREMLADTVAQLTALRGEPMAEIIRQTQRALYF